jgi:hypothetical protein
VLVRSLALGLGWQRRTRALFQESFAPQRTSLKSKTQKQKFSMSTFNQSIDAVNGSFPHVVLRPGDRAKALWKMGRKLYEVEVLAVNTDGTFSLKYEDGDYWENVPPDRISTLDGSPLASALVQGVGPQPRKLRHALVEQAVDNRLLRDVFANIKEIFQPQLVKYSNTNPDIATEDGGAHGEKIDWKVSEGPPPQESAHKIDPSHPDLHPTRCRRTWKWTP